MPAKTSKISRRKFIASIGVGGAAFSLTRSQAKLSSDAEEVLVYIGTYTSGNTGSEGIYIYKLNMESGALTAYKTIANVVDPSFLAIDKHRKFLYAVNETLEYEGEKSGAVSSFAIDRKTGDLQFLNKQPSLGGAPCHVSITDDGKYLMTANYMGGNVAVLPVQVDGRLGPAIDLKQHSGTGPIKDRQEAAHAHSITLDRKNRFAVACDLGADRIFIYKYDKGSGKLSLNPAQMYFQATPGAGPRHFAFHPNGKFAFVINELSSSVTSLSYDENQGTLKELQTISTLPAGWTGANNCADLHVSPDGTFLYGSNRGHDSIVSYQIDERSGKLETIENVSTQGKTPRNFAIDPTGKFLLAANQKSDSIVTFRIDARSGRLTPTGNKASVPSPVCLKVIPNF